MATERSTLTHLYQAQNAICMATNEIKEAADEALKRFSAFKSEKKTRLNGPVESSHSVAGPTVIVTVSRQILVIYASASDFGVYITSVESAFRPEPEPNPAPTRTPNDDWAKRK